MSVAVALPVVARASIWFWPEVKATFDQTKRWSGAVFEPWLVPFTRSSTESKFE